jgi:outer membrane receptor for Fe3+-dicitrate
MNYDPYFQAEICSNCGKIERIKNKNSKISRNSNTREVLRQILGVRAMN